MRVVRGEEKMQNNCYTFKYNQVYKVLVQSSSIQKSSLVLQRVYLKNRADVQVGSK